MKISRKTAKYRPVAERVKDWKEIWTEPTEKQLYAQAARCMDCGVPFCHSEYGCPVDNKIPEWNALVYDSQWRQAYERLAETNMFPEFTGRVCPAPCEGACVLAIVDQSVTIKSIENSIIERAFANGWVKPVRPSRLSGHSVAIIGSGPAGLAAAVVLAQLGHRAVVYEREAAIGGLLRYGIPNVKLDKAIVERRLDVMRASGVEFVTDTPVDKEAFLTLRVEFSACLIATGATKPRDLQLPGRDAEGVEYAMQFLTCAQKLVDGVDAGPPERVAALSAKGKNIVVIGAGDTGCDCIATSVRQGCASVVNFSLMFEKPATRPAGNEWPAWPQIFKVEYGHEEAKHAQGKDPREYCVLTKRFVQGDNGQLVGVETVRVEWTRQPGTVGRKGLSWKEVPGSTYVWPCELALIAIGYEGVELDPREREGGRASSLGVPVRMGKIAVKEEEDGAKDDPYNTGTESVFAAGDCRRGQSLIVWAIKEGRDAAKRIDTFLSTVGGKTVQRRAGNSVR